MAVYGVSIPDELSAEIDAKAAEWYCNRSVAITRIYLEWKEMLAANELRPVRTLPGFIPNEAGEAKKAQGDRR